MEKVGFWCLLLLVYSSAPGALQEENHEQSTASQDGPEDQGSVVIELQADDARHRGADCGCKCAVRVPGTSARPHLSYTVRSVASPHGCKCACAAPPTPPTPPPQQSCEETSREQRLNEKLLAVIDLLEDTFFKTNLLKFLQLSALTAELLERVTNIESVLFQNQTSEKTKVESVPPEPEVRAVLPTSAPPAWQESGRKQREKSSVAAAYQHTESKYEEKFVGGLLNQSGPGAEDVKALQEQEHHGRQQHPKLIVRGIRYYKSELVDETEAEENVGEDESHSGDNSVDLFTEEELLPFSAPSFRTLTRSWPVSAKPKSPTQDSTITQSVPKPQMEDSDSSLPVKMKMLSSSGLSLTQTFPSSTESFTKLRDLQASATPDNLKAIWPTTPSTPQTLPGVEEETTSPMMLNMESTSSDIKMKTNSASSEMTGNIMPSTAAAAFSQSEVTMKPLIEQSHNTGTVSRENVSQADGQNTVTRATPSPSTWSQTTVIPETYSTTFTDQGSHVKTSAWMTDHTANATDNSNTGTTTTTPHAAEGEGDSSTTASLTTDRLVNSTSRPHAARGEGDSSTTASLTTDRLVSSTTTPQAARGEGDSSTTASLTTDRLVSSTTTPHAARGEGDSSTTASLTTDRLVSSTTTPHAAGGEGDSSTTASLTTDRLVNSTTTTIITGKPSKHKSHRISLAKRLQDTNQRIIKTAEDKDVEAKPQRQPGECKDTLATIAAPIAHNTYGRNEGAWMKDPMARDNKIYVANYYYGNNLLEFQSMDVFKQGRITGVYKLPYSWLGTGHAVYDGAFFFNRAFSRDIIKYDLRRRRVTAWTMLHDAALESDEASSWRWTGRSDVELAVDESGLWVIYAALDDEGFLQEVMVLSRLNPDDLTTKRETTWRTGLRRERYSNCFIVCGVLYATDHRGEQQENSLSYAFDTHTNTQMTPRVPFGNNFTYIAQIDYNPKERALYTWNNGHQITYDVVFAYVDPL